MDCVKIAFLKRKKRQLYFSFGGVTDGYTEDNKRSENGIVRIC
jgi:hypothetical protein